jgi:hypothetical protein
MELKPMNTRAACLSLTLACAPPAGVSAQEIFAGSGSASTATFRMDGPRIRVEEADAAVADLLARSPDLSIIRLSTLDMGLACN